jgi:glycerophosphoryl diester phosphodiesterase
MKTLIWAHRGASGYAPENTMEAFKLANKQCADGIELDIHLTKDGHIVVAHDETIDRCSNGSGRIIDKTLAELLPYDFSNHLPNYKNVKIPTLEEVLCFVKETKMTVNIEIKSGEVMYEGIEEKAVELISNIGMKNRVIFSSFNHYSLMLVKKIDASIPIGLLYGEAMVDPHVYAAHLKAEAIHPHYMTLVVPGTISGCKTNGIKINPWTVNDPEHIEWMFKEGINAVITNYPDVAYKLRGKTQK